MSRPYLELRRAPPRWIKLDELDPPHRTSGYYLWNADGTWVFGPFSLPADAYEWYDKWVKAPKEFWPEMKIGFKEL